MSKAMNYLIEEHKNILKVADKIEDVCLKLQDGFILNKDFFRDVIDFVRNYADKFHHVKEENILFTELIKPNVIMHCNPVEQMLIEHDEGRVFIREIENAVYNSDVKKIIFNSLGYVDLIRNHIEKEDNVLYRMVDEVLSEDLLEKIYLEFVDIDSNKNITKFLEFANGKKY